MNASDKATIIGALAGASAGGLGGFLGTGKAKGRKRRIRNAILAALAGGAAGGTLGRMTNAHLDFIRRKALARQLPEGKKAIPGRIYYVSHPENAIDVSKTTIPWIDSLAAKIRKATGWDGQKRIGHAGIVTVGKDGKATRFDYGLYRKRNADGRLEPEVLKQTFDAKGLSDKALAQLLQSQNAQWGKTVDLDAVDVPDIGVVERYLDGLTSEGSDSFSVIPGGYSCGTASRNAFEAARNSRLGHLLDFLQGLTPSANAPRYKTQRTSFTNTKSSTQS